MNNYEGVSGIVYPENGTPLFQEDFQAEAELIGKDINSNYTDIFTAGVFDGFDFSTGSGVINIGSGLGRDSLGRRVFLAAGVSYGPPDGETVDIVARHRWITEDYIPDGSSEVKQKRIHSCEIIHLAAESSPESGDVPVVRVSRSGASVVVVQDLRTDVRLRERFYEYMDTRFGLDFVNSYGKQNLVYNGDFSADSGLWSNGNTAHPDGWVFDDPDTSGTQISKDSDGTIRLVAGTISTYYSFQQNIHEFPGWAKYLKGKKVTVCFNIKTTSSTARIKVYDGVDTVQQVISGASTGKEFFLTLQISNDATILRVIVELVTSNDVVNVISVGANTGPLYVYDLPCIIQGKIGELKSYDATEIPPAGEFLVYSMELPIGYTRLDSYINGKFGRGVNGRSRLDDARGRYERNWANGSTNDPDRASRTNRGDGISGDRVGTKLGDQIKNHIHLLYSSDYGGAMDVFGLTLHQALGGRNLGTLAYRNTGTLQSTGGEQTNPRDRNILKTIRWC